MNEKVPGVLPADVKGAKSGRTSGGYTYGQRERALGVEGQKQDVKYERY